MQKHKPTKVDTQVKNRPGIKPKYLMTLWTFALSLFAIAWGWKAGNMALSIGGYAFAVLSVVILILWKD